QELGLGIDPENPLYQPGGQPSAEPLSVGAQNDALGASTMPASVVPSLSQLDARSEPDLPVDVPAAPAADAGDIDLDISAPMPLNDEPPAALDLPVLEEPSATAPSPLEVAEPAPLPAVDDGGLDFDLSLDEPATSVAAPVAAPAPAPASSHDFGLSSLNLEMDAPGSTADSGFSLDEDLLGGKAPDLPPPDDPMERKFELAEEFRQIGDLDGARELLQEVVANAQGALQAKAQAMLDNLS
ncbi:MAG TPA: FimV/HubP family polar landmark protein, partial [Aquabacterium sp.]|nr:FimV/HubP family polar landmark protein [Aquabacterium sp.]